MSSTRPQRARASRAVSVTPSVERGLVSLVEQNKALLVDMLDDCPESADTETIVLKLREVMGVARIGVAAMLARFFPQDTLREYCEKHAGVSAAGNATQLAHRIEVAWSKPSFTPRGAISGTTNSSADAKGDTAASVSGDKPVHSSSASSSSSPGKLPAKRLAKLQKLQQKQDAYFLNQRFRVTVGGVQRKGRFTKSWIDPAESYVDGKGTQRQGCVRFEFVYDGGDGAAQLNLAVTPFEGPLVAKRKAEKSNESATAASGSKLDDASPSKKKVRPPQKSSKSANSNNQESGRDQAGDDDNDDDNDDDDNSGGSDDDSSGGSEDDDDSDTPASEYVEEDPNILQGISASNILHGKRRRKASVYAMMTMSEPKATPRASSKQDESSEEEEEADL